MTVFTRFFQPLPLTLLRSVGLSLALLAGAAATASDASAAYPDKTIRLVLPLAPGGAMDVLGRALAQEMEESFRRALVVSGGDLAVFVERPISLGLLVASAVLLVAAVVPAVRRRRDLLEEAGD